MSNLGKICCVIAIVCSLAAVYFGYDNARKKALYNAQLSATENVLRHFPHISYNADFHQDTAEPALTLSKAAAAAQQNVDELGHTKTNLTDLQTKLADYESKIEQLTSDYATTQKELDEKNTALNQTASDLQTTSGELKDLKDKLAGRSLDDLLNELATITEKNKVLTAEKKIADDALAKANNELAKYRGADNKRKAQAPAQELNGHVVAINKAWNFVVLDVGKDNKLAENVELTVYRGDKKICKVRTVSVDAKASIADVIAPINGEIQVGDKVLY